jgi:hypothetical protein
MAAGFFQLGKVANLQIELAALNEVHLCGADVGLRQPP